MLLAKLPDQKDMNIDTVMHWFVFLAGFGLVAVSLFSVIQSFVLPRQAQDKIVRIVFINLRKLFDWITNRQNSYESRDRVMAFYAPVGLLLLLPTWYSLVLTGYAFMYRASGAESWYVAFRDSGSSLLTLGFEPVYGMFHSILAFSEATIGLLLVALLIAYLPTMYAAFSRREAIVKLLEVRAGNPPSAVEMLTRYYRIQGIDRLSAEWSRWEIWFAEIDESHSSLPFLVFFRSPQADHSWVTAAGAVLDGAALYLAATDFPYDAQAALCIRAGYLSLRHISEFFQIPLPQNVNRGDPISISEDQFLAALDEMRKSGIPIKENLQEAWLDFSGWRVNYDTALLSLADLVMAPPAPWIRSK
jgi:hypothetical protein